ncbi:hypothetical protein FDUTEX481_00672 [Tolypothrix sp. PCC 7601]|nr:hypothetical protein FDUTEX481_00672 [Tolypothrix sp. PCC 7601]
MLAFNKSLNFTENPIRIFLAKSEYCPILYLDNSNLLIIF